MAADDRDAALRDMAVNRGCKLVKSRRRTPGVGDYGRYGLKDAETGRDVFGFGPDGLTATAEEIEQYLRQGALSDWKSSLGASVAAAAPRRPKAAQKPRRPSNTGRRTEQAASPPPAPTPEPEPEAPPEPLLGVRDAVAADAEAMAPLLDQLGFALLPEQVRANLTALFKANEPPLVAELGDRLVGCLGWHVTPVLHRPGPVGRITMMVVAERHRRSGIGRALVEAAMRKLAERGCGLAEVTSNVDLGAAHAFYRRLGFERTSYRFARSVNAPVKPKEKAR